MTERIDDRLLREAAHLVSQMISVRRGSGTKPRSNIANANLRSAGTLRGRHLPHGRSGVVRGFATINAQRLRGRWEKWRIPARLAPALSLSARPQPTDTVTGRLYQRSKKHRRDMPRDAFDMRVELSCPWETVVPFEKAGCGTFSHQYCWIPMAISLSSVVGPRACGLRLQDARSPASRKTGRGKARGRDLLSHAPPAAVAPPI